MTHQDDLKTLDALIDAIPPGDPDLGGARALREVVHKATRGQEFLGDRAALLDQARARTRAQTPPRDQVGDAERSERLKRRRPAEDMLNLRATREIVEALQPVVAKVRQSSFGHTDPPFGSLEAAAHWIETQSVDRWSDNGRAEEQRFSAELQARMDAANNADPWHVYSSGLGPLNVEYADGDGVIRVRRIRKDAEPLASIRSWTNLVVDRTRLAPAALLALVLVGLRPGERVHLKSGRVAVLPGLPVLAQRRLLTTNVHPGVTQIVIELDTRELTDRNLRRLRQEASRLVDQRRLTRRQQRVVELVHKAGGPPQVSFDRAFWRPLARKLKIDDPIAAARLYYRATRTGRTK